MLGAAQQSWFTGIVRSMKPKEDGGDTKAVGRRPETEGIC